MKDIEQHAKLISAKLYECNIRAVINLACSDDKCPTQHKQLQLADGKAAKAFESKCSLT